MKLSWNAFASLALPLIILLLLVVLVKPVIVHFTLLAMGHRARTAFLSAVSLGQVSEFSLIIVLQGVAAGVLSQKVLALTILLAVLTMTSTSYLINFESRLYSWISSIMRKIGISPSHDVFGDIKCVYDVVLCGYDRIGYGILNSLLGSKKSVVVVDFNPDVITKLRNMGVPCIYGDVCDPEVTDRLDMKHAKIVVSTSNNYEDNLLLLQRVKSANRSVPAIMTAHKIDDALELYSKGADYVILPHFLGGDMVSTMLPDFESSGLKMTVIKERHINELLERKNVGHDHPTQLVG